MEEINENLIQKFRNKLEEMSYYKKTFKKFDICHATYTVFSPEIYIY